MSTKRIARSVYDGRLLTFSVPGKDPITGYVAGADDYHWLVLTPDCDEHLVHKAGAAVITFASYPSYDDEPNRDRLEAIIGPFRARLADDGVIPQRPRPRPTTASERTA